MDVHVIFYLLILSKQAMAVKINETQMEAYYSYEFVADIIERNSSRSVAIGVCLSRHWVLTVAHVFPPDWDGLPYENYSIIAGQPSKVFYPTFAITHPAYTSGLYTAEDLALFYVKDEMKLRPVFVSAGRFPWNSIKCSFVWSDVSMQSISEGVLQSFKSDVTVVQNCLARKHRKPIGLLQFYMNDVLCGKAFRKRPNTCVGKTGGFMFCNNLLVGLMIRSDWCPNKTANFTDLGSYTNWLRGRVSDGNFIRLPIAESSASVSLCPVAFTAIIALTLGF